MSRRIFISKLSYSECINLISNQRSLNIDIIDKSMLIAYGDYTELTLIHYNHLLSSQRPQIAR
jgi:hypothetical protein